MPQPPGRGTGQPVHKIDKLWISLLKKKQRSTNCAFTRNINTNLTLYFMKLNNGGSTIEPDPDLAQCGKDYPRLATAAKQHPFSHGRRAGICDKAAIFRPLSFRGLRQITKCTTGHLNPSDLWMLLNSADGLVPSAGNPTVFPSNSATGHHRPAQTSRC